MAEKVQKTCSNCETKYTITWNIEEQDLEPLTCPFCGFEVDNEQEEVEWVNKDEDEDDNWN
jgi:DNA-directed RNA polymerase subunit RPC12/RpoP